jgi:hypothetical protein
MKKEEVIGSSALIRRATKNDNQTTCHVEGIFDEFVL